MLLYLYDFVWQLQLVKLVDIQIRNVMLSSCMFQVQFYGGGQDSRVEVIGGVFFIRCCYFTKLGSDFEVYTLVDAQ